MPDPLELLLVEDNQADVRLTCEALASIEVPYNLSVESDGEAAVRVLRCRPFDLVLLDLILPRMDGLEVLRALKEDPALRRTIVVVLTGTSSQGSIRDAYELGANCCLIKPTEFGELVSLLSSTIAFWSRTARPFLAKRQDRTGCRDCQPARLRA